MPASRQGSPDRRGPRDGDFKAGPVCGGRVLQPKEDYTVKEIAIPSSMQKTLIFVVDLSDASLMDPELKSIDDLKEDVLDAMSVSSSKKEFQVILSGYEGHERTEISDSDALKGFFERLEISADGNMMDMIGESGGSSTDRERRVLIRCKGATGKKAGGNGGSPLVREGRLRRSEMMCMGREGVFGAWFGDAGLIGGE